MKLVIRFYFAPTAMCGRPVVKNWAETGSHATVTGKGRLTGTWNQCNLLLVLTPVRKELIPTTNALHNINDRLFEM